LGRKGGDKKESMEREGAQTGSQSGKKRNKRQLAKRYFHIRKGCLLQRGRGRAKSRRSFFWERAAVAVKEKKARRSVVENGFIEQKVLSETGEKLLWV